TRRKIKMLFKEMDKHAFFSCHNPTEGEKRDDLLSLLYIAFDDYKKHKNKEELKKDINNILEREGFWNWIIYNKNNIYELKGNDIFFKKRFINFLNKYKPL
ncbi:MAG: hypothetical protein ACRCUM_03815, partial [Mycoplasmoidaceae bacterium]